MFTTRNTLSKKDNPLLKGELGCRVQGFKEKVCSILTHLIPKPKTPFTCGETLGMYYW